MWYLLTKSSIWKPGETESHFLKNPNGNAFGNKLFLSFPDKGGRTKGRSRLCGLQRTPFLNISYYCCMYSYDLIIFSHYLCWGENEIWFDFYPLLGVYGSLSIFYLHNKLVRWVRFKFLFRGLHLTHFWRQTDFFKKKVSQTLKIKCNDNSNKT